MFVPAQRRVYCTPSRPPRTEVLFMACNMPLQTETWRAFHIARHDNTPSLGRCVTEHRLQAKTSPTPSSLPYKIAALREAHLNELVLVRRLVVSNVPYAVNIARPDAGSGCPHLGSSRFPQFRQTAFFIIADIQTFWSRMRAFFSARCGMLCIYIVYLLKNAYNVVHGHCRFAA